MTAQETKTIDITPTWAALMPALIAALQNGTQVGKDMAVANLRDLAAGADRMNAAIKEIREHDAKRNADGRVPDGGDYLAVLRILGVSE